MIVPVLVALSALLSAAAADIAIAGVSQTQGVTQAEMQAMLDEHNALRTAVAKGYKGHGPAADMLRMEFSSSVQANAQRQAALCNGPPHGNSKGEGQNFAFGSNAATVMKSAIRGWFHDEEGYYRYGGAITKQNGHFTQMIWASSYQLGCGSRQCGIGTRFVCNFKTPGNYPNQKPYIKGAACSACPASHPFCLDSLCSSSSQCRGKNCKCTMTQSKCKNGQFDGQKCTCKCKRGSTGPHCDEVCKDSANKGCYGRAKQGQCAADSPYHNDMFEHCKPSCKLCEAECLDSHHQCDLFKKAGKCNDNYVRGVCAKTCGFCS